MAIKDLTTTNKHRVMETFSSFQKEGMCSKF